MSRKSNNGYTCKSKVTYTREGKTLIMDQRTSHIYTLLMLAGEGVITHLGIDGDMKFQIDGEEFTTLVEMGNVCFTEPDDNSQHQRYVYYDYSNVDFGTDPKEFYDQNFVRQTKNGIEQYWCEVKPTKEPSEEETAYRMLVEKGIEEKDAKGIAKALPFLAKYLTNGKNQEILIDVTSKLAYNRHRKEKKESMKDSLERADIFVISL